MSPKKTRNIQAVQQPSPGFGIYSRGLIRLSKENLERLSTLRFHCSQCKRWLPALSFYAKVRQTEKEAQADGEAASEGVYLARYEVKAEGSKGRETVVICEECAADMGQGQVDRSSHKR